MKPTNFLTALFLCFLLLLSTASAGTLISGSKIDVQSNYAGFNNLSLVGTWSTTPAVSDQLIVNGAMLPAPYALRQQIVIDVQKPTFEQRFEVVQQQALYVPLLVEQDFWIWNIPGTGKDKYQLCDEAVQSYISASGKKLWTGTGINVLYGNAYCHAVFVLQDSQQGWIGSLSTQGYNYYQTINVDNIATLHLIQNENTSQLVDKVNNVVRATLVNFGDWTNAKLSDSNTWGYHEGNTLGSGPWTPFYDSVGSRTFASANSLITTYFSTLSVTSTTFSDSQLQAIRNNVQVMKDEVARLKGASATPPASWINGDTAAIRTAANTVIVPYARTALTANIQFVMSGQSFGLIIPTGIPSLVSYDKTIQFDETAAGILNYQVKNIGSSTGTFSAVASCNGGKVITNTDEFSLVAGQTYSGKLRNTAKTTTTAASEKSTCTLTVTETNTQQKVTGTYTATVITKSECAAGQQSDPKFNSDGSSYVETYDTLCNVISTTKCSASETFTKDATGNWICKAKEGGSGSTSDDASGFSTPLFVVTIILSLAATVATAVYARPVKHFHIGKVHGAWLYITLIAIAFIATFFLVPFLWKVFLGFLTEVFSVKNIFG
jgi:hypothetical protein